MDCPVENLRHHDMDSIARNFSGVSCISYQLISARSGAHSRFSCGGKLQRERHTTWKTVIVFKASLGKLPLASASRESRGAFDRLLTPVDRSRLSGPPPRRAPSRGSVGPVRTCVVGLAHLSEHSVRALRVCSRRSGSRGCDRTFGGNDLLRRSTARIARCRGRAAPRGSSRARPVGRSTLRAAPQPAAAVACVLRHPR